MSAGCMMGYLGVTRGHDVSHLRRKILPVKYKKTMKTPRNVTFSKTSKDYHLRIATEALKHYYGMDYVLVICR